MFWHLSRNTFKKSLVLATFQPIILEKYRKQQITPQTGGNVIAMIPQQVTITVTCMFILSTYCVCNDYLLDSRMGSLFWLRCHTLCEYAPCLWPHRGDIKGQSELTETDVTCLSFHSGGIEASTGHRGGRLDQRPGSVINPVTHPYQWKRCASAFPACRERHEGRELRVSTWNGN